MRTSRAARAAGVLLAAAPLISGCYGGKTWEAVQRIELQTAALDSLNKVQQGQIAQMRKDLGDQQAFLRSSRADTETRIAELARRLDVVVGKLEDNNQRFSEVLQRFDIRRAVAAPADTSRHDSTGAPAAPGALSDPKPLYDAAYADFTSGRYDLARTGFQQFVASFPQTELAGNAQYWIGETYYQQKRYAEAVTAYRRVLDQYPHNIKVSAAMLKLGQSQIALGNRFEGRATLNQLIKQYPGTEEAAAARRALRSRR